MLRKNEFFLLAGGKYFSILGDSILKGLGDNSILYTTIQCRRGVTIRRLEREIRSGVVSVDHLVACIVHVGTNDVANGHKPERILKDYADLLHTIRARNRTMLVLISAILPREKEFWALGDKVHFINDQLKALASRADTRFLKSYVPFLTKANRRNQLPRKKMYVDGVHLEVLGETTLRRLFAMALGKGSDARRRAKLA
jgi:lysophospholipase L1-like esterase